MSNENKRGKQAMFDTGNYEIKPKNQEPAGEEPKTKEKSNYKKFPRMYIAFYNDNMAYLKDVAWENRMSVTQYVNHLIEEDRKQKGR